MFRRASEWGYLPEDHPNPARGIEKYDIPKRDRWVAPDEMGRLAESIRAEESPYLRAVVWLYLLTGMRRAELLGLRWEDVKLDRAEIRLEDTKAGRPHTIPVRARRRYEQARPQLARDVEDAARLMEEERERLIRGAGSLSARDRTTAAHSAAVAAVEDVDAKLRDLRAELEAAEEREARDAGRAEVATVGKRATKAQERFTDGLAKLGATLSERVAELADRYEEWTELHRAGHAEAEPLVGRGVPGLLRELAAEGAEVEGLQGDPSRALSPIDRDPVEAALLKLVKAELGRRQRDRVRQRDAEIAERRAERLAKAPEPGGAYAILTQRAGDRSRD